MLEQITARDNLNNAFTKVRRKKGAGGVDKMEVSELPVYLRTHREELVQSILDGTYRPNPVRRVEIPKENGKTRGLGIPTAVDRSWCQCMSRNLWKPAMGSARDGVPTMQSENAWSTPTRGTDGR